MAAGLYKIVCEQGATFNLPLQWIDATGAPVDMTGYSAQMDVRASKTSAEVLVELSTANGRISLDSAGNITLSISATDTATLIPGQYVYDLELTNGSSVERLIEGAFVVDGEVTR